MNKKTLPLNDPAVKAGYIYIALANNQMLGWEYLRRNKKYQLEYAVLEISEFMLRHAKDHSTTNTHISDELTSIANAIIKRGPSCWGLVEFVSPFSNCEDGIVHWHDPAASIRGNVINRPPRTNGRRRDPLETGGNVNCVFTPDGYYTSIKHLLTQVNIHSDTVPFPDQNQTLDLDLTHSRHMSTNAHDIFDRPEKDCLIYKKRDNRLVGLERHIKTLRILDGHFAGLSHQDIAKLIYGCDRVKEWSQDEKMRDDIKRHLRRGLALVDGGYMKLVKSRPR